MVIDRFRDIEIWISFLVATMYISISGPGNMRVTSCMALLWAECALMDMGLSRLNKFWFLDADYSVHECNPKIVLQFDESI